MYDEIEILRLKGGYAPSDEAFCGLCCQVKPFHQAKGWGVTPHEAKPFESINICPECMEVIEGGSDEEIAAHAQPVFERLAEEGDEHDIEFVGAVAEGYVTLRLRD